MLHWYTCGADGRWAGGRAYGGVIKNISRMGRLPHFLRYDATLARAWDSAISCDSYLKIRFSEKIESEMERLVV